MTAMIHSTMAHSLELEDHHSHKHSLNHPGVCSIPPALAVAEREGKSGRDFLMAVVLGYEIGSRISAATRLGVLNLERGFHESSVCGPFSAATVAGRLMGIGAGQLVQAYGICGGLAAGSMEFKSSEAMSKRLQVGNASHSGVMAAELAAGGFTGPPTVFEGKHGFYHSYVHEGNYTLSRITDGLGAGWDINHIQYKPFACAGILHSAVTAAQKLRQMPGFDAGRLRRIVVGTASKVIEEYATPAGKKAAPDNPVGAQFSLQYSVAVMIVREGRFSMNSLPKRYGTPRCCALPRWWRPGRTLPLTPAGPGPIRRSCSRGSMTGGSSGSGSKRQRGTLPIRSPMRNCWSSSESCPPHSSPRRRPKPSSRCAGTWKRFPPSLN